MSLAREVSRTTIATGVGDLAALVGEPSTGTTPAPPVLLVPGYTGSKEDFLPVLGPLARAGHRAVAIDLRGQYESAGPDDPSAYAIDALAKDVAGVLADLSGGPQGTAHLVGHSFGGLVTRAAVIGGARPRTHVLVGSGPGAIPGRRRDIVPLMLQVAETDGMRALADAAAELDAADPRMAGIAPEVIDFLHERWINSSPLALRVMGDELLSAPDEVDDLAAAGVRTLVVHGEADDAWPPDVQEEMAKRLGAEHVVIADSVHSPACEQPEAFVAALVAFWQASRLEVGREACPRCMRRAGGAAFRAVRGVVAPAAHRTWPRRELGGVTAGLCRGGFAGEVFGTLQVPGERLVGVLPPHDVTGRQVVQLDRDTSTSQRARRG